MEKDYYVAYVDGCCEPTNPGGNMGIGSFVLNPKRERIFEHSKYISSKELSGNTSNNIAEYMAVISVLEFFLQNNLHNHKIIICGDSKLSIMQMGGSWKARGGAYIPYYQKALGLKGSFSNISFQWIPREKNNIADELSKNPMIKAGCEFRIQPNK